MVATCIRKFRSDCCCSCFLFADTHTSCFSQTPIKRLNYRERVPDFACYFNYLGLHTFWERQSSKWRPIELIRFLDKIAWNADMRWRDICVTSGHTFAIEVCNSSFSPQRIHQRWSSFSFYLVRLLSTNSVPFSFRLSAERWGQAFFNLKLKPLDLAPLVSKTINSYFDFPPLRISGSLLLSGAYSLYSDQWVLSRHFCGAQSFAIDLEKPWPRGLSVATPMRVNFCAVKSLLFCLSLNFSFLNQIPPGDMQTIKCVVVGDGAVGKARYYNHLLSLLSGLYFYLADLLVNFIHNQQVS